MTEACDIMWCYSLNHSLGLIYIVNSSLSLNLFIYININALGIRLKM